MGDAGRGEAASAAMAMAIRVRDEDLRIILMQAMFAAKSIRGQRDRLLHHQEVQLQRIPGAAPEDLARMLEEAISGLEAVCSIGIKAAARYLTICLDKAAKNGARRRSSWWTRWWRRSGSPRPRPPRRRPSPASRPPCPP